MISGLRAFTRPRFLNLFLVSPYPLRPVPTEGALEGARTRGRPRRRWRRCAPQVSGSGRRHPDRLVRWPCGRATPVRRPKPRGPGAPAARHRDMTADASGGVIPLSYRPPPQRWVGPVSRQPEKGAGPERSAHRGPCGASLKHRARDADGFGGLAVFTHSASLGVARHRGPRVFWTPAFRAPSDLFSGNGILSPPTAYPAPPKQHGRRSVGLLLPSPRACGERVPTSSECGG